VVEFVYYGKTIQKHLAMSQPPQNFQSQ